MKTLIAFLSAFFVCFLSYKPAISAAKPIQIAPGKSTSILIKNKRVLSASQAIFLDKKAYKHIKLQIKTKTGPVCKPLTTCKQLSIKTSPKTPPGTYKIELLDTGKRRVSMYDVQVNRIDRRVLSQPEPRRRTTNVFSNPKAGSLSELSDAYLLAALAAFSAVNPGILTEEEKDSFVVEFGKLVEEGGLNDLKVNNTAKRSLASSFLKQRKTAIRKNQPFTKPSSAKNDITRNSIPKKRVNKRSSLDSRIKSTKHIPSMEKTRSTSDFTSDEIDALVLKLIEMNPHSTPEESEDLLEAAKKLKEEAIAEEQKKAEESENQEPN